MVITTATDTLVKNVENRGFGIINFGTDNKYPNYTRIISDNSAALKRVQQIYRDFVFGNGISTDTPFWKMIINPYGLRVDQLLRRNINDFSEHKGCAIQVVYNGAYEKIGFVPLPFETFRLEKPDDNGITKKVKYYKDWSAARIDKNKIQTFDVYNPDPSVIASQMEAAGGPDKYKGQIFYYGDNGEVKYPHNMFHAAIEDAITDIAAKNGRNANVSTNFMASHFFQLPFTFADYAKETGDTVESVTEDWQAKLANFQSAENLGKLMLFDNGMIDNEGKMRKVEITKLDLQNYDGMFSETEQTVKDNLRGQYRAPAILFDPVATGFSTDIMDAAYNFYNNITGTDRKIHEEIMTELFANYTNAEIVPHPLEIEPLSYLGYDEGGDGSPLAVQLGVGGTSAMQNILIDPVLTDNQKIETLQILFGLSEENAKKMMTK